MNPKTLLLEKPAIDIDKMSALLTVAFFALLLQIATDTLTTPDAKTALAEFLETYNGVLNTITAAAVLWLIKWIRDKVKNMFQMYETVVGVTKTVVTIQEKVEAVAEQVRGIAGSQETMRKDMATIKSNTSAEVRELKEQFLEVLDEWKDLKRRLNM